MQFNANTYPLILTVSSNEALGTGVVSRARPTELTQCDPQVADRGNPFVGWGFQVIYNTGSLAVDQSR